MTRARSNKQTTRRGSQKTRRPNRDNLVGAFDQSMKYLLQKRPQDFIAFGLHNPDVRVLCPIEGAVPALGRELDGGYRVRVGGAELAAHLEFHRRHQSLGELGQDVLEAQVRIYRREGVPVLSLVFDLYGEQGGAVWSAVELSFGATVEQAGASRCVYQRVNFRGMHWKELLGWALPTMWSLVPLTRDGTQMEALLAAREAIEGQVEVSQADQADQLVVMCFLAEAEDVAAAAIREYLVEEKLMQSTLYESILQKGINKGLEKGRVGMRDAILDMCELLSIEVGPQRRAHLEGMNLDQLSALRVHLKAHRAWPSNL